jgi:hypothetical protein
MCLSLASGGECTYVHALAYFDEVLGWTIGDLNYLPYLQKRVGGA